MGGEAATWLAGQCASRPLRACGGPAVPSRPAGSYSSWSFRPANSGSTGRRKRV